MRSGRQYVESLRDDRCVYVDGERVRDVATHPAFRGIAGTIASLYDAALDPANEMRFAAPETGEPANRTFMIPRSVDDLRARRAAITRWARLTNGLVGRGPDHVGSVLAGFASAPEVFARGRAPGGCADFGENVRRFYRTLLAEDLYVAYVIIPPQIDRSTTAQGQPEAFLQAGVYAGRDGGIVVRGAQMLGTGAAIANYLFVSCIVPLRPDDEDYALSFVVPIASRELKLYPRALGLLRHLAGGGLLQVPDSYKALLQPETAPDIRRYVRSTGAAAEERVKLFKLAWDLVGSEFGSRHHQYEMFYAGAPYVSKAYAYRNYRYEEAVDLVDQFLGTYDLPSAVEAGEAQPATGAYTRLLRFDPGTDSSPNGVLVHDHREEVYIVSGAFTNLRLGQTFRAGCYACRPPGMPHGPWRSEEGILMVEFRYGFPS